MTLVRLLKAHNFMVFNKSIYYDLKQIKDIADASFQNKDNIETEMSRIQTLSDSAMKRFPEEIKEPQKSSGAFDTIMGIVCWVIIICGGIFLAWFLMNRGN